MKRGPVSPLTNVSWKTYSRSTPKVVTRFYTLLLYFELCVHMSLQHLDISLFCFNTFVRSNFFIFRVAAFLLLPNRYSSPFLKWSSLSDKDKDKTKHAKFSHQVLPKIVIAYTNNTCFNGIWFTSTWNQSRISMEDFICFKGNSASTFER